MSLDYSIVVPCYRSAAWLPELVARTLAAMRHTPGAVEIILVNDASPDETWSVIAALARTHPEVRGFDLLGNVGQFRATICGLEHARGATIVTMDDDLQHRPEDVPTLIERLLGDPETDCVVAAFPEKRHGKLRNLGSRAYHRVEAALYGFRPELRLTAFRAMRRTVADTICAHRTARPVIAPLLLASTSRIVSLEVTHEERRRGKSGYRLADLVGIARDSIIAGSTAPLHLLTAFGLAVAIGSSLLMSWYLGRYLVGATGVRGFTTEVLLISFFGGCTLLAVGILGEYIARILAEVAGAPRWALRGTTSGVGGQSIRPTSRGQGEARGVGRGER